MRRVVEPLLSGAEARTFTDRDLEYTHDLGLVARDVPYRIANPIYAQVALPGSRTSPPPSATSATCASDATLARGDRARRNAGPARSTCACVRRRARGSHDRALRQRSSIHGTRPATTLAFAVLCLTGTLAQERAAPLSPEAMEAFLLDAELSDYRVVDIGVTGS